MLKLCSYEVIFTLALALSTSFINQSHIGGCGVRQLVERCYFCLFKFPSKTSGHMDMVASYVSVVEKSLCTLLGSNKLVLVLLFSHY